MTVYMMRRGVSVRPSLDRMIYDTLIECSDFPMQDNRSVNHTAEKAIEGERERERERERIDIHIYVSLLTAIAQRETKTSVQRKRVVMHATRGD